ncbi:MAG: NAD(P)-dependent oxidoreductase [Oligoflexia bacterium]|nr:NAD(P)-dependent oxidoreductase [Oligoflexia bacterium]
MPKVAITGANGFIGSNLVRYFLSAGWEVVGLVRRPELARKFFEPHPRLRFSEFRMPGPIPEEALRGCDYLIHCAHVAYSKSAPDADQVNQDSTRALLDSSRKLGVRKFVFVSSLSAHERALSHYSLQKLRLEKLFDPEKDLIIRPGLVIGPGGLFGKIARNVLKSPWTVLVGGGRQLVHAVWVGDLCRASFKLLEKGYSGSFDLAETEPCTLRELCAILSQATGRPPRFVSVPLRVVSFAVWLAEFLRVPLPFSRENLLGLKALQRLDVRPLPAALEISLMPASQAAARVGRAISVSPR